MSESEILNTPEWNDLVRLNQIGLIGNNADHALSQISQKLRLREGDSALTLSLAKDERKIKLAINWRELELEHRLPWIISIANQIRILAVEMFDLNVANPTGTLNEEQLLDFFNDNLDIIKFTRELNNDTQMAEDQGIGSFIYISNFNEVETFLVETLDLILARISELKVNLKIDDLSN